FSLILYNNNLSGEGDKNNNEYYFLSLNFLQNSYAIESDENDENSNNNKDSKETKEDEEDESENNKAKSIFNIVAVGDWDCTSETEDTVDNIIKQDPEFVLALGDLSYNGKAKCWLKLIEPIAEKTKIVIGNHEVDSSKLLKDYMNYFGLENQYYSFNQKNVHFLALSTETDFDEDSEQYAFAKQDLEKYSKDPFIDWIIVFYHRYIYGSGSGLEEEKDFRETYHPLFDKYKVDLALQGHLHVYERTYPITFNNDDDDEPIVQDNNPNLYKNPKGTIFLTVGTGGAHDMQLSSLKDFSVQGIAGEFGILNIQIESDQTPLIGQFIENGKKHKIADEFKIIKN
ncbi:MAG TPA: metallophosphoesterase, partial [Nitrososphaeraceae archaeon]|nr:metallophosphoesterase [Nitrososphaeraceae archaeon]